jgi:hypothetical protein
MLAAGVLCNGSGVIAPITYKHEKLAERMRNAQTALSKAVACTAIGRMAVCLCRSLRDK